MSLVIALGWIIHARRMLLCIRGTRATKVNLPHFQKMTSKECRHFMVSNPASFYLILFELKFEN